MGAMKKNRRGKEYRGGRGGGVCSDGRERATEKAQDGDFEQRRDGDRKSALGIGIL